MRKPGEPLVDWLMRRNMQQSEEFTNPDAVLERTQYRAQHPTAIAALKCMDGRLLLPYFTKTPPGIIQPFRNIGGIFDLGWPFFSALMKEWVEKSVRQGNNCLVLITYHYSKGDTHRGCAGHGYNTDKAREKAFELKEQFVRVFGSAVAISMVVGIETDEDALVFHSDHGDSYAIADHVSDSESAVRKALTALYPSMPERAFNDLIPLVTGNQAHVAEVRASERAPLDAEHREQILAIGRGFDWLHMPNKALIVGPFSYDLAQPIATAATILLSNITENRVPREDGVVLITSAPYRGNDMIEKRIAIEKTKSLMTLAMGTVTSRVPELKELIVPIAGIVDAETRVFVPIEWSPVG